MKLFTRSIGVALLLGLASVMCILAVNFGVAAATANEGGLWAIAGLLTIGTLILTGLAIWFRRSYQLH